MTRNQHLTTLLASGFLTFSFGCTLGGGGLGGPGNSSDGGGNSRVDGGSGLGSNCAQGPANANPVQSGCRTGLLCEGISTENPSLSMCSGPCDQTTDCGTNTAAGVSNPNVCNGGLCYPGCDITVPGSCGRLDFVCEPTGNGNAGVCTEDCSRQALDFCQSQFFYPFWECDADAGVTGDPNYGLCNALGDPTDLSCSSTMPCADGTVCAAVPQQSPPEEVCATDCALSLNQTPCNVNSDCETGLCDVPAGSASGSCDSCGLGYSCGPAAAGSGSSCAPVLTGNYGPCVALGTNLQCSGVNDFCLSFSNTAAVGPTVGMCVSQCGSGFPNCPGPQTCSAFGVCLIPCTTGSAACPSGTACEPISGVGDFCEVVPMDAGSPDAGNEDAGTPDAGPVDAGQPDSGPSDAGPADAGMADAGCDTTAAFGDGGVCEALLFGVVDVQTDIAACQAMDAGIIVPSNFTAGQCCNLLSACTGANDVSNVTKMADCFQALPSCTSSNESGYQGTLSACAARSVELTNSCAGAFAARDGG